MASNDAVSGTPAALAGSRTARWSAVVGSAADLLPSRARACDIIVAGGPGAASSSSTLDDPVNAIALLSSGWMTLLAPRPGHLDDIFRSVLIAWDDSAAVSRTMAQAMPLIAAAGEVRLFIGETSPDSNTPSNDILAYLRRKGVQPDIVRTASAFRTARETLVRQARELEASLIIMGAYKHSRVVLMARTVRRWWRRSRVGRSQPCMAWCAGG